MFYWPFFSFVIPCLSLPFTTMHASLPTTIPFFNLLVGKSVSSDGNNEIGKSSLRKYCMLCFSLVICLLFKFRNSDRCYNNSSIFLIDKNFTWNVNSTRDVATYVQPENVTAIIPNEELCTSANSAERDISSPPFLLVVICSAVQNFRERQAIRQTWMSMDYFNWTASVPIRSAFLLGRNFNESLQSEVMAESKTHGDIIQEGFVDSYLNLYVKYELLFAQPFLSKFFLQDPQVCDAAQMGQNPLSASDLCPKDG